MTLKEKGFRFPAEWEKHKGTWLSFPHNEESWGGEMMPVMHRHYMEFVKAISKGEHVYINVNNTDMRSYVEGLIRLHDIDESKITLPLFATNDCWCRDHGGAFVKNDGGDVMVIDWGFNAWGGKYPSELDNQIPQKMAKLLNLPFVSPGIIMEGGSVEFNGCGSVLTTESCLLNKNRNPHLNREEIERYLCDYYGIENVIWLGEGIVGDDTDGHIDDLTRFVNSDTVITAVESNKSDINYKALKTNVDLLAKARLETGKQLNIVDMPMPKAQYASDGYRLPASYCNFYIANDAIIVPVFRCKEDEKAIAMLESLFTDRKVIGVEANEIVHGLGTLHCMSQQVVEMEER